jgi:hypothetical protein
VSKQRKVRAVGRRKKRGGRFTEPKRAGVELCEVDGCDGACGLWHVWGPER